MLGALAAYPLARSTVGSRLVLAGVIGLIMVPPLSILVPLYSMMSKLGLVNAIGTILVMTALQLPLAIFLYAAFMRQAAGRDRGGRLGRRCAGTETAVPRRVPDAPARHRDRHHPHRRGRVERSTR